MLVVRVGVDACTMTGRAEAGDTSVFAGEEAEARSVGASGEARGSSLAAVMEALLAALTFATLMKCCLPWMAAAPKTKSVVKDWTGEVSRDQR